jgi:tetratricopeptide (TPR) repeat protein
MKKILLGAIAVLMMGAPVQAESLTPGQQFSLALHYLSSRSYGETIRILEGFDKYEQNESQAKQVSDLLYVAVWQQADAYEAFDIPKAIEFYEKAERLRPTDLLAQSNRGFLLCKLKRYAECDSIYKKLVDVTTGEKRVDQLSGWAIANQVGGNKRKALIIAEEGQKYAESIGITSGFGYRGFELVLKSP